MSRLAAVAVGLVLSASPLYAQETLFTVTVTFGNIHAGPSTDSWIIAPARPGTTFAVTREVGKWVAVPWPAARDGVGYLHTSWGKFSRTATADTALPDLPVGPIEAQTLPGADSQAHSGPIEAPAQPGPIEVSAQPGPIEMQTQPGPQADPAAAVSELAVPDAGIAAPSSGSGPAEDSQVAERSAGGPIPNSTIPTSERAPRPGYSVQVAAIRDLKDARTLSEQLTKAGYSAYLTTATVKQVRFHRVRVGPFETRQTAQKVAQQLETQGYQSPWITK
jgi:DedD protein